MATNLQSKHYRYLVYLFNLVFCLMGFLIISFGVWVHAFSTEMATGFQRQRDITNAAILLIVAGVFVVFVVAVGNYAACKQEKNILCLYTVLVVLVFILEIAAGLYAYNDRHYLIIENRQKNNVVCKTNLEEKAKHEKSQSSIIVINNSLNLSKTYPIIFESNVNSKDGLKNSQDLVANQMGASSGVTENNSRTHDMKNTTINVRNTTIHSRHTTKVSRCTKSHDLLIRVELIITIAAMLFACVQLGGVLLLIKLHALYSPELHQYIHV